MATSFVGNLILICIVSNGLAIYVDHGNPYTDSPLKVGEMTLSITAQDSPVHTKVYFPQGPGLYPAVVFLPGFNGYIFAEFYESVLVRIASHGFFVFGLDYKFPGDKLNKETKLFDKDAKYKDDVPKLFQQVTWLQNYMRNKTLGTISWNQTALLCHSAGCDSSIKMIKQKPKMFTSTIFLEPVSLDVSEKVDIGMPALMYGTQLSEESITKCSIPGFDYNKFYDIWSCPKMVMNVADFGHCDILDPLPWTVCKDVHFCKITTNTTKIPEYHEFVQGVVSSFYITTLQGRYDAIKYVTDKSLIPLKLLELKTDFGC